MQSTIFIYVDIAFLRPPSLHPRHSNSCLPRPNSRHLPKAASFHSKQPKPTIRFKKISNQDTGTGWRDLRSPSFILRSSHSSSQVISGAVLAGTGTSGGCAQRESIPNAAQLSTPRPRMSEQLSTPRPRVSEPPSIPRPRVLEPLSTPRPRVSEQLGGWSPGLVVGRSRVRSPAETEGKLCLQSQLCADPYSMSVSPP